VAVQLFTTLHDWTHADTKILDRSYLHLLMTEPSIPTHTVLSADVV